LVNRPYRCAPVRMLVLACLVLPGCGLDSGASGSAAAPEYQATTLEGDTVRLTDFGDRVVLLNLWATWCPPCRWEMPHLQTLHEEFRDQGLQVVGVSVDAASAERSVLRFLEEVGVDFLILRDPGDRASRIFRAPGLPLTLLIDGEGMVRWRHLGPVTSDNPELRALLAEALGELDSSRQVSGRDVEAIPERTPASERSDG